MTMCSPVTGLSMTGPLGVTVSVYVMPSTVSVALYAGRQPWGWKCATCCGVASGASCRSGGSDGAATQSRLVREDDELGAVASLQLAHSTAHVRAHRVRAHEQSLADLVVRQSLGDECDDLALPVGQRTQVRVWRHAALRAAHELSDQAPGHGRGQQGLPGRRDPDRAQQLGGVRVLDEEPAR